MGEADLEVQLNPCALKRSSGNGEPHGTRCEDVEPTAMAARCLAMGEADLEVQLKPCALKRSGGNGELNGTRCTQGESGRPERVQKLRQL